MPAPTVAAGLGGTVAMTYSANRHVAILGDDEGALSVLDLRGPTSGGYEWRVVGRGYRGIGHLAYDDISDRLIVVDADGTWVARLPVADRADATAFVVSPTDVLAVHTVSVAGAPAAAVLEGGPAPCLAAYNLGAEPGSRVRTLLGALVGARAAAIADSTSAFLLASSGDGTVLRLADWRAESVTQTFSGALPFGDFIAALDSQWALVVSARGEFACIRRDGTLRLPVAAGSPSAVVAAVVTSDQRVLMATEDVVLEDELVADLPALGRP